MPVQDIHTLKKKYSHTLFAVDMVSSAPYPAIDFTLIDSAFFSVQKGFGMPAGLGVWIVNDKCLQKAETLKQKGLSVGTYHSLSSLWSKFKTFETPATPNVLGIYLLGKIAEEMNRTGIETIRRETEQKAAMVYTYLKNSTGLTAFVDNADHQSQTVIVAEVANGSTDLIQRLSATGNVVGSGYGSYKEKHIRVANFPAVSLEQTNNLIAQMQGILS
jgi:phosphoserine aminotransferase